MSVSWAPGGDWTPACVFQVLQLPQQTLVLQTHHALWLLAGSARVHRSWRRTQQVTHTHKPTVSCFHTQTLLGLFHSLSSFHISSSLLWSRQCRPFWTWPGIEDWLKSLMWAGGPLWPDDKHKKLKNIETIYIKRKVVRKNKSCCTVQAVYLPSASSQSTTCPPILICPELKLMFAPLLVTTDCPLYYL